MVASLSKLKGIVAVIVTLSYVIVTLSYFAGPALAEQAWEADEATLLERLADADEADARRIDRELQALWRKSGSPSMDLLLKRGRDALDVGDFEEAIEHLTALTDHAPDFAEGWHARATAYYQAELYGPCVADLERALTLNPNNYQAIFGLGAILETFGDEKRAYEAYLRAKAIHPNFDEVSEALERLQPRVEGTSL